VQRQFGGSLDASDPRPDVSVLDAAAVEAHSGSAFTVLRFQGANRFASSRSSDRTTPERTRSPSRCTAWTPPFTDWSLSLWASARWSSSEGEATRMGRPVDDLLQLAELDQPTKSGVVSFGPTDHAALTLDATADARAADPARSISFTDPPSDVLVPVDSDRLRQVLANLTDQRHRANPTRQSCRRDAEDNPDHGATRGARPRCRGPGMAADDVARIFERCYRTDSSRSR
jgi:signal transduction histidine kinase